MPLYSVPMTILATVNVFADSPVTARVEARRYAEALETDGFFKDGWNEAQRQSGGAIIDDMEGFEVENIELEEVELLPARWVVTPQNDLNADLAPESEVTRFEACEEDEATVWAVFETDAGGEPVCNLVEDYPSREQAEAAVKALEGNNPLPDPVWPEDAASSVAANPHALIADAMVLLDAVNDAESDSEGRCFAYLADGRVLRITAEYVGA